MSNPKIIAFYLPQFHPISENDKWWGKGFTEWTNVGKAKPLFPGHNQPRVPADLGYYDLRVPETRDAQAELAKEAGVYGFMYWHYWFAGKRLLERPAEEVLKTGKPDFPFAFAWANESWKGFAHGLTNREVLMEQTYPGEQDYISHFYTVLPFFKDNRYIKINDKPLFLIYKPHLLPNAKEFIKLWQELAKKNGLNGIYFIAHHQSEIEQGRKEIESKRIFREQGFDAINYVRLYDYIYKRSLSQRIISKIKTTILGIPLHYRYSTVMKSFIQPIDKEDDTFPTIIPNWDHTPRSKKDGVAYTHSTPENFRKHITEVFGMIKDKKEENQVVFLKSWNEWAEGNYMEPDMTYGKEYIWTLRDVLNKLANEK